VRLVASWLKSTPPSGPFVVETQERSSAVAADAERSGRRLKQIGRKLTPRLF
jgi:hypothetical protein